eukprot:6726240-Prymnesium_polylepis.1
MAQEFKVVFVGERGDHRRVRDALTRYCGLARVGPLQIAHQAAILGHRLLLGSAGSCSTEVPKGFGDAGSAPLCTVTRLSRPTKEGQLGWNPRWSLPKTKASGGCGGGSVASSMADISATISPSTKRLHRLLLRRSRTLWKRSSAVVLPEPSRSATTRVIARGLLLLD